MPGRQRRAASGGSDHAANSQPRDSTTSRAQPRGNATFGRVSRCRGFTSTTSGTLPAAQDQEIRDMPALPAVHPGRQQERLSEHRLRAAVEIGIQQPGQLKPRLVDHMPLMTDDQ
jgi:hypothetical protein